MIFINVKYSQKLWLKFALIHSKMIKKQLFCSSKWAKLHVSRNITSALVRHLSRDEKIRQTDSVSVLLFMRSTGSVLLAAFVKWGWRVYMTHASNNSSSKA